MLPADSEESPVVRRDAEEKWSKIEITEDKDIAIPEPPVGVIGPGTRI